MNRPFAFDARELAQHVEWVRALARRLVLDDHQAEDLAQETWLAALRHPPESGRPIRPWLAAVLRNFRKQSGRSERRRKPREWALAEDRTTCSAAVTVSEVESHRLVVEAVLALSEPTRSTILLHYFRGWSLAVIARRTDTPEGTVRSRLQRGLQALRSQLDADHGGDRRSADLALLPLLQNSAALPAASSSFALGVAMLGAGSKKLLLIAAVLVLVPAAWMILSSTPDDLGTRPRSGLAEAPESGPPAPTPKHEQARAEAPAGAALDAPDSRLLEQSPPVKQAIVRGRFVDPAGQPINQVEVSLSGHARQPAAGEERAPPFEQLTQTSGPNGRFEFQFAAPGTHRFSYVAKAPVPFVRAVWTLGELEPAELRDQGDLTLERGGTVLARVVDQQGQLIASGWRIQISRKSEALDDGRSGLAVSGRPVAGSGSCHLERVPPGHCETAVIFDNAAKSSGPEIDVLPSQLTELEIRYAGPDPARRIQLAALFKPKISLYPEPKHVRLSGAGLEPREPEPQPYPQEIFVFDDVPPGRYTLEIDDPRFEPWTRQDVAPGASLPVFAKLKGNSALRLSVTDRRTGSALKTYRASLLPKHWRVHPKEVVLLREQQDPPPGGIFDGLVAHDYVVRITAEGFAPVEQQLRAFLPGETRRVTVDLVPGGTIAGVVFEADGSTPAAVVSVGLYRPAEVGDGPNSPYADSGEYEQFPERHRLAWGKLETDQQGRFRFERIPSGTYALRATMGSTTEVVQDGLEISLDEVFDDLRLVLPGTHYLFGTIGLPPGMVLDRVLLAVFPESGPLRPGDGSISVAYGFERGRHQDLGCIVGSNGAYRVGPLPPGPARVALMPLTLRRFSMLDGGREKIDAAGLDLGMVTLADAGDTRHDFDLRTHAPGQLELQVLVRGGPTENLRIDANPLDRGDSLGVSTQPDQSGAASLQLFPGLWTLAVSSREDHWSYHCASPIRIVAGAAQALKLHIHLVDGVLTLLDDLSGKPLAGRSFHVRPTGQRYYGSIFETDGAGRLHLKRPVGELEISPILDRPAESGRAKPERHTVIWSADGPEPDTIRFSVGP